MSKYLKDGESRRIKPGVWGKGTEVIAFRADCDSPFVFIKFEGHEKVCLTDVAATDLLDRLKKALSILPTSK